jgi:hypothetical protein
MLIRQRRKVDGCKVGLRGTSDSLFHVNATIDKPSYSEA